jgi:hypothetical protein
MNTSNYAVVLVYSTSHALKVEKILGKSGIPCKLIPVPRYLSSDCGSCVRILQDDKARVLQELETARVEIAGIQDI